MRSCSRSSNQQQPKQHQLGFRGHLEVAATVGKWPSVVKHVTNRLLNNARRPSLQNASLFMMAPPRKPVAKCQDLSLKAIQVISANYIKKATEEFVLKENILEDSISDVSQYLFKSTPQTLCSNIADSFLGALVLWLQSYDCCNTAELNDSVYVGLRLAEVIATSKLEKLDLSCLPKQIRSSLYGCLKLMPNVKYLNLGSGHGGWLSDTFCNRFYGDSFASFKNLVALHFHHDCTDHLLVELISRQNCHSLKILDISFSQNVSDVSADCIGQCPGLLELDIIGSSLSVQAVVFILRQCRRLQKINAVKVAQALEDLEDDIQLELVECMPETDRCGFVTATTPKHLRTLSSKCAKIRTLSIFSESNYAPLDWNNNDQEDLLLDPDHDISFKYLQALNVWGGRLPLGTLRKLGAQLLELKLVHVENVTLRNLREVSQACPLLESLELQNCSIQDNEDYSNFNSDGMNLIKGFVKLKQLIIVSKCSEAFINRILKLVPGVQVLQCGTSTGISDQVLERNMASLSQLQVFKVAHSRIMTLKSVQLLLDHCPALAEISDLASFPAINRDDLVALENHLAQSNIDVRIS